MRRSNGFRCSSSPLMAVQPTWRYVPCKGTLQKLGYVVQLDDVRLQTNQTTLVANGMLPDGTQEASFTAHAQSQDLKEIGHLLQNDVLQGPADFVLRPKVHQSY